MGKRRKARESALQILFQLEFNKIQPSEALTQFWNERKATNDIKEYSSWLVHGIISNQKQIDRIIQSVSQNWRISRMAAVDLNILRMAVYELFYEENLAPAIVIDEAIEIAKKFSSDKAAAFINGILDTVKKGKNEGMYSLKDEKNG